LADLFSIFSGVTKEAHVDPDGASGHLGQVEIEVNGGVAIEDREDVADDIEAKKRHALQLKMHRLAERLYPENGLSVLDILDASNICTLDADLPGDKRCDKTYKPIPNDASDSESSIPSIIFDERGNEVIIVEQVRAW
jgi:hypothetical protein